MSSRLPPLALGAVLFFSLACSGLPTPESPDAAEVAVETWGTPLGPTWGASSSDHTVSADGSRLAYQRAGQVTVIDRATDTVVDSAVITSEWGVITHLRISPDGSLVAAIDSSMDGTQARVWTVGSTDLRIVPVDAEADEIQWSANGSSLAIGGDYVGKAKLWDLVSGTALGVPVGDDKVVFSPDLSLEARVRDREIHIAKTEDGKVIHTLRTDGRSWRLAWSPDGSKLAADDMRGITVFDTQTGKTAYTVTAEVCDLRGSLQWSDADTLWTTACPSKAITHPVQVVDNGSRAIPFPGPGGAFTDVVVTQDEVLFLHGDDAPVVAHERATKALIPRATLVNGGTAGFFGDAVGAVIDTGYVVRFDPATGQTLSASPIGSAVGAALLGSEKRGDLASADELPTWVSAVNPYQYDLLAVDGEGRLVGWDDHSLEVIDPTTKKVVQTLRLDRDVELEALVPGAGRMVLLGYEDVRVLADGKVGPPLTAAAGWTPVASNGTLVVVKDDDKGTFGVVDTTRDELQWSASTLTYTDAVAISPDGSRIVANQLPDLMLYDAASGSAIAKTALRLEESFEEPRWRSDGQAIVARFNGGWRVFTLEELFLLPSG